MTSSAPKYEILLAELIDYCKEMAAKAAQGEEAFAECAYCHGLVPLWEALFTQQLAGLFAHVSCPQEMLQRVVGEAAPDSEFDYEGLVAAVQERMERQGPAEQAGCIEVVQDAHTRSKDPSTGQNQV